MDKEFLLQELSAKMQAGELTYEEIAARLGMAQQSASEIPKEPGFLSHFSVTKMLYVLGAAVVVVGIIIFVGQIWEDLGTFGRIVITLGLGLLTAGIGSSLLLKQPDDKIGAVFHVIGGLLIPGGAVVTLSEINSDVTEWQATLAFGVITVFYLLLNRIHRQPILTFFAIANGTAFLYIFTTAIMMDTSYRIQDDVYAYLTMGIGGSYLLLAHGFRNGWNKALIGALYFFGSIGFLGAGFTRVFETQLWELLYFVLVFGGLFLSVYMKSRLILIVSTLFLIAHVSYITGEYFADSIGWPISLVILGFMFIGLGYGSLTINKKYIQGEGSETYHDNIDNTTQ